MKVVIGYPPLTGKGAPTLGQNRQFQWFHNPTYIYPMVPASAATVLKERGYEVYWKDGIAEEISYEAFEQFLDKVRPDLFVTEAKSPVIKQFWKIIHELKEKFPEMKIAIMGDHLTAFPEETMKACPVDYVFTGGHYDVLTLSLCNHLSSKTPLVEGIWYRNNGSLANTGPFKTNYDLNTFPWIDRELTQWHLYGEHIHKGTPFTYTMAGRDCAYNECTFCSWVTTHPRFTVRDPDNVVEEIDFLVKEYKIREIFDDTGTLPAGGWLDRFCEGLIRKKLNEKIFFSCNYRFDLITRERARLMKRAGFRLMKIGLESASQETLDRLKKNITISQIEEGAQIAKEEGLRIHLTSMVGYPWETRKDAMKTLAMVDRFMKQGYLDIFQCTIVMPYPGTPLYQEAVEKDWLSVPKDAYEEFDMTKPIMKMPDMSSEEVMKICDSIWQIYLHPRSLYQYLKRARNWEDVRYLARGIKPVIGHIRDFLRK